VGEVDPGLPAPLISAVRDKNLLVVCGAGVSMAAPSNLPSWWGFNNALFEGLRAEAAKVLPDLADALMARPLEGRVPVSAFSELVVSTFAGNGYFPLLTALEGARPNANHFALAVLAREGVVADIVSFNFDTLIEQAFRSEKTPLRVMVRPGDYDQPQSWGGGARLHKVHGSVTDAATLIDTVTQKLKGMDVGRRARLRDVFSRRHVLFLGFSGADFDFGSDYLPMSANAEGGFGFTWLHRGASLPALADRFTDRAGAFVSGDLPAFLSRLGLEIALSPVAMSTTAHLLEERVQAWVSDPTVGPWASAAFMHAFAEKQQDEALLSALSSSLETAVRNALIAGQADMGMGGCVRRLALHAMHRGEFARALAWSAQELQFHEAIWKMVTKNDTVAPWPEVRLEYLRNTASVYVNMAKALINGTAPDRLTRAKTLLLEANARARGARDRRLLALIQFNLAVHIETRPDASLMALRAAQAAAREVGAGRTLVEAAFIECWTLIGLSELDLAGEVLKTIRPLLRVVGEAGEIWKAALYQAFIYARRGNFEAAMVTCEAVGQNDPVGGGARPLIVQQIRSLFSGHPDLHVRLSTLLVDLGDLDPIVIEAHVPFALMASGDETEDAVRRIIAEAEYQQRHETLAKAFERLARLKHACRTWARLGDVAIAFQRAAERAGAQDSLIVAHQYRGIASEMLGDLGAALSSFTAAVRLSEDTGLCPGTQRANLAGVIWRLGELDRAEMLYCQAQDEIYAARDWSQLATATINFGRKLVEVGRAAEAAAMVRATAARPGLAGETDLCAAMERMALLWANGGREPAEAEITIDPDDLTAARAHANTAEAFGNLAIAEIEAGETDAALDHIEAAKRLYVEAGNVLGQARCEGNLAQLHAHREAWDAAIAAQRRSVALRDGVGDGEELLLAESNLAFYLLNAGHAEEALDTARLAVRRVPAGSAAWPYAVARWVMAIAALELGRFSESRQAIPAAIAALRVQRRPEREPLIEQLRTVVIEIDQVLTEAAPDYEIGPAATAKIVAARADRDLDAAGRSLQAAAAEAAWSDIERATFFGEAGSRFFQSGAVDAALDLYRASADAYAAIEHPMAWHARRVLATTLMSSGDRPGAQAVLAEILERCPVAKVRIDALTSQAELVLMDQAEDKAALAGVRDQMLIEWMKSSYAPESMGRMGLMLCQVQAAIDDFEQAKATLAQTKALLVSCNSEVLPAITQIEAMLARAEAHGEPRSSLSA